MSREVRRVPLDFDWPLGEVWAGYLRPDQLCEKPCPAGESCLNGQTSARAWVGQVTSLLLALDDDRDAQQRERPMHPYFASVPKPWRSDEDLFARLRDPNPVVPRPSPDIAEFGAGLAGRSPGVLGHDSLDQWRAEAAVIRAVGLDPDTWGLCSVCGGHATVEAYPGQRADAEAWEPTGPPVGEGWQLWETVPEGSPLSPVFDSADDLARWLTTPEGGRAAGPSGRPLSIDQARGFVAAGWAPTGVSNAGGYHPGVEYVGTDRAIRDSLQ